MLRHLLTGSFVPAPILRKNGRHFLRDYGSVCPLARQLNDEYRCRLVMGDKLPREIENPLWLSYNFEAPMSILTEQGEVDRAVRVAFFVGEFIYHRPDYDDSSNFICHQEGHNDKFAGREGALAAPLWEN